MAAICLPAILVAVAASAQESPELPSKTTAGAAPRFSSPFYKEKGPGHGNSYLARFEEDYSYLRDPALATDFFDPLKFIPLDTTGDVYLTLNGEVRFRYDNTSARNLRVAGAAVGPALAGGLTTFRPESAASSNELYKQRYKLGADLHVGPNLRFYADLYHGQQTGHDVGPAVPGSLRNDLDLVNGFGEAYTIADGTKTGLRIGRQEVYLGNDLQVRANVSTNLPSPSFDGFRAYRDWGFARLDAFGFNLVRFEPGILQGKDIAEVNLWGLYGSYDLPHFVLPFGAMRSSVDLFYLGWRAGKYSAAKGEGMYDDRALLTGYPVVAATGAGFLTGQDQRHTFGLRLYGAAGPNIDYDWQGAYQIGSYAGFAVDAFAFNTDTGYTFRNLPWKPRLGVHIDGASGGADKAGGILHTYQPMYPDTHYYAPNNEFAPTNFYDVAPRISFSPTPTVRAEYYFSFLWRYSQADAIYTGAPWPGAQGQNSYAVTALTPGGVIGRQSDLRVTWTITPHVLALAEFGLFWPGSALRTAGGRTTTFLDANLTFRF